MNSPLRFSIAAALLLFSAGTFAQAGFTLCNDDNLQCSVSPPSVPVGATRTVSVTWRGELAGANLPATVRSNGGIFQITTMNNQSIVLGSNFTAIQQSLSAGGGGQFQIAESLQVPESVTRRAQQEGATVVQYRRQFSETVSGARGETGVNIRLTPMPPGGQAGPGPQPPDGGPGAGGEEAQQASRLEINRLALRFDDDETLRVVARDDTARATAYINYSNAGLFSGIWEIATPESTRGEPVFRPLNYTRRYLGVGREAVLQSPELPTESLGLYMLRLRVEQPRTGFEPPVIRYMVRKKGAEAAFTPDPVRLSRPGEGASLATDTEFRWSRIGGASAYQLELYERPFDEAAGPAPRTTEQRADEGGARRPRREPSTGIVVPGNRTRLQLSAMVRQHLQPGRQYHWRIIAVNREGRIIGVSPLREIRVP